MIVSLNWLRKYVDIDIPTDELVELIDSRLVEIEDLIDLGKKYQAARIVRVVQSDKVANSDHLSLIKIDDGGSFEDIERDQSGLIQVVCGAPNMRQGLNVVWLPPNSIVPSTYSDSQPFKLEARQIKGVISYGMIASARELDISDEHEGILEINDEIEPGTSFKDVYELDDILLSIDNKPLTHRPDCFSLLGIAREVSAILGKQFINPDWFSGIKTLIDYQGNFNLSVKIEDPEISARYQAVMIGNLKINQSSPLDIQTYLARSGVRPINLIVDVTNYLMLLTGQPLHAFDYDKLVTLCGGSVNLSVRLANDDERLELLDGREIKLTSKDIIIAANNIPIALAGAMGGASTAIDENTKRIVIESASFNLYNLRSTQMRHGVFSEAITRFTKGQPAELTEPVIHQAISMLKALGDGEVLSSVVEDYPVKKENPKIEVSAKAISQILGRDYQLGDIKTTLENTGFDCQEADSKLLVKAPYWRTDIEILEDVAEEIGRINGFDNIKAQLPLRFSKANMLTSFDEFRAELKDNLVRLGANEILSYSFVHGDLIDKVGQDVSNSYRLINSISPTLQYCRQSLTPSLLNASMVNTKAGFDKFAIFEINKTHDKSKGLTDEGVPIETESLALVVTSQNPIKGAGYYLAKQLLDDLAMLSELDINFKPMSDQDSCVYKPFEKERSAIVYNQTNGEIIGVVGEYRQAVINNFKLSNWTAGFELDLITLQNSKKKTSQNYQALSKFPYTERDVCFQLDSSINYSQLDDSLKKACASESYTISYQLVDIYKPQNIDSKNITFRFKIFSYDHTIDSQEANGIIQSISKLVISDIKAKVI